MPRGLSVEKIIGWINNPTNFLIITGPAGVGKTFFCSALVDKFYGRVQHMRAYDDRDLFSKVRNFIASNESGDYLDAMKQYVDDYLIILDDLGSSGHTKWREEILTEFVDYRYETMMPTVITSNLSKAEIYDTYGERIGSRMFASENLMIDMSGMPDLRLQGK